MRLVLLAALSLAALQVSASAESSHCAALGEDKKKALVAYVRAKYKLPESVSLRLAADDSTPGTCFHRLTFEGVSTLKTWELTLYLSPDGRYLTSDLFDTTMDPAEEGRRRTKDLMASLSDNKGASLGPANAPVTIVEFSDFECPYCRRFVDILKATLPSEKEKVRVVFHHLPLSMHPWARRAAEGAACAQLQSSEAFWTMQGSLFEEQTAITMDNVNAKLYEIARGAKGLDLASFQACLDNEMSLGLVLRDINLAASNEINATPTIFINGHRIQGVKSVDQLRDLIAEASEESRSVH